MPNARISRRQVNAALVATGVSIVIRPARSAEITLKHSHNLPVESPLHKRATEMWAAVRAETNGRVDIQIDRSADAGLDTLVGGALAFMTLAGNGLASLVPAADVQATPYGFRNPQQVYAALDGALGAYLREEMRAHGIYAIPNGCFENGMHQITCSTKPIRTAADLQGLKMRIPGTPFYQDFFKSLGAEITTVNLTRTYEALKSGRVEAQDDPWDVVELFKFYEVQKYASVTDLSWSGYNLLASRKIWDGLPADVQGIIERNTKKYVALQRGDNDALNADLRRDLEAKGMVFNDADQSSFRASLAAFYPRWKQHIGTRAWDILESQVGTLG
jgi:tripartite ATP-independent transporter DctP family solute receptor